MQMTSATEILRKTENNNRAHIGTIEEKEPSEKGSVVEYEDM